MNNNVPHVATGKCWNKDNQQLQIESRNDSAKSSVDLSRFNRWNSPHQLLFLFTNSQLTPSVHLSQLCQRLCAFAAYLSV